MTKTDPFLHENGEPSEQLLQLGKSIRNLFPNWIVHVFETIDSTNAEARRLSLSLGGDAWPRVILTDHQHQGKGRQNKSWVSPKEKSLLVTIMNPISQWKTPQSMLPLAVACWLMEGLERNGADNVQVKWPNDILISGQKVGGILSETSGNALVLGIGINLEQDSGDLPSRPSTEPQATSLKMMLNDNYPGWITSAVTLMSSLMENIENPQQEDQYLKSYRSRCATIDQSISFNHPKHGLLSGIAKDINTSGNLVVEVPDHGMQSVTVPSYDDVE